MQNSQSPQSPNADSEEPDMSMEQVGKDYEQQPVGYCNQEVQVPPTPTANHNHEELTEDDRFSSSRMYLSGLDSLFLSIVNRLLFSPAVKDTQPAQ